MPFVAGFLRLRRRRPGGGGPTDPDYGVDEGVDPGWGVEGPGDLPEVEPPEPPIGIWPPLTPEHPWRPIPSWPERPSTGPVPTPPGRPPGAPDQGLPGEPPTAGHLPSLPPGTIWPPLPPGVHGKYLALVLVAGMPGVKYRYVVIDADARPEPPAGGVGGTPPARPEPKA